MTEIEKLSERWREEGVSIASQTNALLEKFLAGKLEDNAKFPEDTRADLADAVLKYLREANKNNQTEEFRAKFPPAHAPFINQLDGNGQAIAPIILLDDGRIIVGVGGYGFPEKIYQIQGESVSQLPDVFTFGRSANRKYFAKATNDGIEVLEGWDGFCIFKTLYPSGLEGIPSGYDAKPIKGIPYISKLIPFPDGQKVLLVSSEGIFVLSEKKIVRLHPSAEHIAEHFDWLKENYPADDLTISIDMAHGAVSPDGKWIALGDQCSNHLIFNDSYNLVGDVYPSISYPHYAVFDEDSKLIAFNSCHFYNGATYGIPIEVLPTFKFDPEQDERAVLLEDYSRVYAGLFLQNELIMGNASGDLIVVDKSGKLRWIHHLGSTISDMDVSDDGETLIVSSHAGFLSIVKMNSDTKDVFQIGTANHKETRRFIFWKQELTPLIW
jgi:hypothetical protein